MKEIVPWISPLVESQFPSFYKEEGPQFIAFVKAYYEWMELPGNVLYQSRNLLKFRDIDQTLDEFIVFFKEEMLKNVQFDTATNKELLVKNALNLYRSKGTERAIDLFFKLVFGIPAKVYYPGDDLFKLSDNTWKIPTYLEVSDTPFNASYEGRQITGITSGATAFVETYSIKKIINTNVDSSGNVIKNSKNIHVFFISNLKGNFETGETVVHSKITDPKNACKMIGSLSTLSVISGAADYKKGDIVKLISNTGINGKALVTNTIDTTGQVEFIFRDGGWGYTANPRIIVSDKAISVANIQITNSGLSAPFMLFESLIQPKANIMFESYAGNLDKGDFVYNYHSNGVLSGTGKIIDIDLNTSSANGEVYISILNGNITSTNTLFSSGNTSSFETIAYENKTSSANIMGISVNNFLIINDLRFNRIPIVGETVYQSNSSTPAWVTAKVANVESTGEFTYVHVTDTYGNFIAGERLFGTSSLSNASLYSYNTSIGVFGVSERTIVSVDIENGGEGYKNNESLTFSSTTGFGASGKILTNSSGNIVSIELISGGSGYLTAPAVFVKNTATDFHFNSNTDINEFLDFIAIPGHDFENAQPIRYLVTSTNTNLLGLISNNIYYVNFANSLGIKISNTAFGDVIPLSKGKTENGHSFAAVVSGGQFSSLVATLGSKFDFENNLFAYGSDSNTVCQLQFAGEGTLAGFEIRSLDDEQTISLNTDFIYSNNIYGANYLDIGLNGSGSLSGSSAFGFPGNPSGNLINDSIKNILSYSNFSVGTISGLTKINPGDDYTLDPFVAILEPIVYGYKRNDSLVHISGFSSSFALNEKIFIKKGKKFDANTGVNQTDNFIAIEKNPFTIGNQLIYIANTGNTPVIGLANNTTYYVVFSNSSGVKLSSTPGGSVVSLTKTSGRNHTLLEKNYIDYAIITDRVDDNTIKVKLTNIDKTIDEYADIFIRGETSQYETQAINFEKDLKFSGFNAIVEANVLISNGSVSELTVIDSGFGYEQGDVSSFYNIEVPDSKLGVAKVGLETQGRGSGFYKNTKSFLSYDKYLQDNEYYQDYSYEVISRIPFEKYAEMLRKILHVSGTKAFPRTEIYNTGSLETTPIREINVKKTFNPFNSVNTSTDFISFDNEVTSNTIYFNANSGVDSNLDFIFLTGADSSGYLNNTMVKYEVSFGNTAISGLANGGYYYVTHVNSSGICVSSSLGGSNLNLTKGLNQNGHNFSIVKYLFSNGEKVYYTVDTGNTVIPGTQINFNPRTNLTADKIFFNANTNVDSLRNFIAIPGHEFNEDQIVRYIVEAGNTNLNPLANSELYYVIFSNTSGITISNFKRGEPIKVENGLSENGHSFSTFNDFIFSPSHPFSNGSLITYTVSSGNLDIFGLSNNSNYWVNHANTSGFKLSYDEGGSKHITYSVPTDRFRIKEIIIDEPGISYDSTTSNKLLFVGENIEEAQAIFTNNVSGAITSIIIQNNGLGYTVPPTIIVDPRAGGSNARFTAVLADDIPNESGHFIKEQLINNYSYYVTHANTTGLKLSITQNGSSIVNLSNPPNQTGHGIYKFI